MPQEPCRVGGASSAGLPSAFPQDSRPDQGTCELCEELARTGSKRTRSCPHRMGAKQGKAPIHPPIASNDSSDDLLIGFHHRSEPGGHMYPKASNVNNNHYNNNNSVDIKNNHASTPKWSHKSINVMKMKAWIDKRPTTIEETTSGVLKYKTPHFRAIATVEVPALQESDKIQVGWIQSCFNMKFFNTYGAEGATSWEFPELVSGKCAMISDADGKGYPWYGVKNELVTLRGPHDKQTVHIEMNDNFFPQVTWHIPDASFGREPRLTHIHRKQRFYTCLAVRDCVQNRIFIYKTVTWSMELNIQVEPNKAMGERATLLGPMVQEAPRQLKKNIQLPVYALKAPNANRSQALIWRPANGDPRLVVPPIETTVNMDEYLNAKYEGFTYDTL